MFYVVLAELSTGFTDKENSSEALTVFALGFMLMMTLDTMLG